MKRILFISNITNKITNFSIPSIEASRKLGYEFHLAADLSNFQGNHPGYNVITHHIDLVRNPLSLKNMTAYKQMKALLAREDFDVIHCNTPIGGLLGRLCGKKAKVPIIIYTAHGFHFYKGASFISSIYKVVEHWLARYTDAVITINHEDYQAAQKFRLRKNGNVYYVPGVGIDTEAYKGIQCSSEKLRSSLGLHVNDIVIISMGDLIYRKNYPASLQAIAKTKNSRIHYLICGDGPELDKLRKLVTELGIDKQIHFLGYRNDIKELLSFADIFLFTSFQEGLPRSLMEAMAAGLPCIASKIRGNTDLLDEGKGGFLFAPKDIDGISRATNTLIENEEIRNSFSLYNHKKIKEFDIAKIIEEMYRIYKIELVDEIKQKEYS